MNTQNNRKRYVKVLCLETGTEYYFQAKDGLDAIKKMLYTLNMSREDTRADIQLCNGRTWALTHTKNTYVAIQ